MRLRPTRRLPGMLVAAAVIYVFATNSQVIWLYLVSSLVAGLALVGLLAPWMTLRRLRPAVSGHRRAGFVPPLPRDRGLAFVGDVVTLVVAMGEPRAPVAPERLVLHDGAGLPLLDWRVEGASLEVDFLAEARGPLQIALLEVSTSWPLGVARAHRTVDVAHELVVHPRYQLPPEARRPGAREPQGASARRGAGEEFLGLREYRSGDSQRRIHWPTSARSGTLMVVETAREASNASLYHLELGVARGAATELAVQLAASLSAGSVASGVPVSVAVPGQPRHLSRWGEVLAALARAEPGGSAPQPHRDALQVVASAGQVTVVRGGSAQVLDGDLGLEAALKALGEA